MTDAEIERLYARDIEPAVQRLEPLRRRARWGWIACVGAPLATVLATVMTLVALSALPYIQQLMALRQAWVVGGLVALASGGLLWGIVLRRRAIAAHAAYADAYKREIVTRLVAAFDPSWTYDPHQGLPYREYEASEIAVTPFDDYSSEDTIRGTRDGREFVCVDLHARAWRGRGDDRKLVTLFQGLFLRVRLGVHLDSRTLVLADHAESALGPIVGKLLQRWNLTQHPLVNLEDSAFEREFVVYSSDPVAAHLLLSPLTMARLTALRRAGRSVSLAFQAGVVTIAVDMGRSLFEPSLGQPASRQDAVAMLAALSVIGSLVDAMPLARVLREPSVSASRVANRQAFA